MHPIRSILSSLVALPVLVCLAAAAPCAHAHLGLDLQIEALDEQIEAAPRDAALYARRGELLRLHGEIDRALADLKTARALDRSLAIVDFHIGRVHLDAGRGRAAERALTRFLKKRPDHAAAHVERARARVANGRAAAAAGDFSRAIELQHAAGGVARPSWYIERARALASLGEARLPDAIRGLDEGSERLGRPVTLQLEAIELEQRAGRVDAALERLRAEARRTPRPETWFERIGDVQREAGRLDEARRSYRDALDALGRVPQARRWTRATRELEARVIAALDELAPEGGR